MQSAVNQRHMFFLGVAGYGPLLCVSVGRVSVVFVDEKRGLCAIRPTFIKDGKRGGEKDAVKMTILYI